MPYMMYRELKDIFLPMLFYFEKLLNSEDSRKI